MKKTIVVLSILIFVSVGLFASDGESAQEKATINVSAEVAPSVAFGITVKTITEYPVKSFEAFRAAVSSTLETSINMVALYGNIQIALFSGINNTKSPVTIAITISDLVSGNNAVALDVSPTEAIIPAAADSSFGVLRNLPIGIHEAEGTRGKSLLAPAGDYKATITFTLIT